MKKSIIRFISTLLVVMLLSESLSFVAFANDKSGGYVETHHQFNMEDINLSVENKNKLHISFDKSLNVLKNNKLNKEKKMLEEYLERYSNVYKQLLSMANKNVDIHTFGYTEAEMEYDEENQTFVRVKDENKAQNVNALLGPITAHAETVVRRKGEEKKKYYFSLVTSISRKGTSNPYVYDTTTYGAWSENNSIGGKKYPASGDDYILQACPSGFTRRSDSLSIIYNHNKKAESGKDYSSLAGDRNYIAYSVSDDPSGINQMSSVRLYASSKGNRANYYRTINSYYVHTWKSLSIKVSASASANSDKKYGVSVSITPSVSEKSWQVYSYVSFQL